MKSTKFRLLTFFNFSASRLVKTLRILLTLGIFFRVVFFFLLPQNVSTLAPDEAAYSAITAWVKNGWSVDYFPGLGPAFYERNRTYILLSVLFHKIGFSAISSIRLVSLFSSLLSLLILYVVAKKTLTQTSGISVVYKLFLASSFMSISLFPSNIAWGVLGLREATSQLFLLVSFLLFANILTNKNVVKYRMVLATTVLASCFAIRSQSAWVLAFSIILGVVVGKSTFKLKRLSMILVTISLILGSILSSNVASVQELGKKFNLSSFVESNPSSPQPVESNPSSPQPVGSNPSSPQPVESNPSSPQPVESNPSSAKTQNRFLNNLTSIFRIVKELDNLRDFNRIDADSALAPSNCPDNAIASVKCISLILPYQVGSFLFRPILFYDNSSVFATLAGIENLFWYFLYFIFGCAVTSFSRNVHSLRMNTPIVIVLTFVCIFTLSVSLYFGNLGTGFRLRSTLLWALNILAISLVKISKPAINSLR